MEFIEERFGDVVFAGDAYFAVRRGDKPYTVPDRLPRRRDYYELYVLLSGRAEMSVIGRDGRTRVTVMLPGHVYVWRPQDYRFDPPLVTEPITFIGLAVRASEWEAATTLIGVPAALRESIEAPIVAFDPAEDDVIPRFREVVAAADAGARILDLARFLVEIVPRIYDPVPFAGRSAVPWLFAGVEAMREEENLRAGMPRFRELTRVSARQLTRLTQTYLGTTPGAIVAEARLRHAMRLLETTSITLSTIAARCGYGTPAQFSYRFRIATGQTPSEFRRRHRRRTGIAG